MFDLSFVSSVNVSYRAMINGTVYTCKSKRSQESAKLEKKLERSASKQVNRQHREN